MITQIIKFLRVLGSEASPMQISMAIALAMVAGLTPLLSLHNLLVVFILLSFRINLGAFILALGLFSGMGYLLDSTFHHVGMSLLKNEALQSSWTVMYNSMFWRIAHFNNSIVMGSLAISLLAFVPLVLLLNVLIKKYRSQFLVFLKNSKTAQFLQNSKMFTRISALMES